MDTTQAPPGTGPSVAKHRLRPAGVAAWLCCRRVDHVGWSRFNGLPMIETDGGAVDTGGYAWPTPWGEPKWRQEAVAWIKQELGQRGLTAAPGQISVRLRPWSVILRIPTETGSVVWFKANPPGSAFEPGLAAVLHRLAPSCTLAPMSIDRGRAWSLMPDGGDVLAHMLPASSADVRHWVAPLREYSELQRVVAMNSHEMIQLGVPDFRPVAVQRKVSDVVNSTEGLGGQEHRHLHRSNERFARLCAELDESGFPASLDHGDLHEGQVLVSRDGRHTFFDWGDSSIAHPLMSFLSTADSIRKRFRKAVVPQVIKTARSAYLEPWTSMGWNAKELKSTLDIACSVGLVAKALRFGRLFPGPATESVDARVLRCLEDGFGE